MENAAWIDYTVDSSQVDYKIMYFVKNFYRQINIYTYSDVWIDYLSLINRLYFIYIKLT